MSTVGIVITVVVIVVVLLLLAVAWAWWRRRNLRRQFGPEYDHVVEERGGHRMAAERELRSRERQHKKLQLRTLETAEQKDYLAEWNKLQTQFVEAPRESVRAADDLVTRVMAARGYPVGELDERIANLSVEHAATLDHYRAAHEISRLNVHGQATTEQLRQAVVHYRALASDLLGTTGSDTAAASRPGSTSAAGDEAPSEEHQS
jgi:hypothetical protein